ncbi:hypothetical protein Tco_1539408 [Tanacetum coccineum]
MSNLKFAETHNLVAFLEKPKESNGFEGIIDFLNASSGYCSRQRLSMEKLQLQAIVDVVVELERMRFGCQEDASSTQVRKIADLVLMQRKRKAARQRKKRIKLNFMDNTQAMMEADYELAQSLQAENRLMEIVPDDEVSIDAIPLATKSPIIVDWKIIKEGKMGFKSLGLMVVQ